ncbi:MULTISPECIES: hypothetical protein [Tenebrionibacter/Tenebrionicola group]|jgi:hypothetical protein|uniref:Uncharacterized protein n=2 Tax=Tenebrionibacter/Tenebrionicola group TaxID=2969848 RepID=A0A8K0V5L9_9ENTR|nr:MULTISPECIES: hypothetical protein [Tenebrionibacter/Tenebrionicola group]MBK4715550.1 hypothetical protein [Tenebrionibacter intestinalis]MBV4411352.1 hypothetical protein [Tenebrionicola larvae]MBV5095793.1 hypothetical protein [Tenebrionicola larvae]
MDKLVQPVYVSPVLAWLNAPQRQDLRETGLTRWAGGKRGRSGGPVISQRESARQKKP